MSLIRIAAVYRPGKALTGVSTYARSLRSALKGHAEIEFMENPPKSGYDLIHILDIKCARLSDFKNSKAPVIADLHDYYWAERKFFPGPDLPLRWLMHDRRKKHYTSCIAAADAVIVHSHAVEKYVVSKKVLMVPLAVDFEKFYAPAGPEREPFILLVGRDSWRKGLGTLISALKMVVGDSPELRVEVIGKEYLHTRIWARLLGLGVNLKFLGELQPEELVKKYRKAMIVYLGSYLEGFGLSLAEGMAAGCVGVGSNAGGIPEIIQDGSTGILFQPGDRLELSAKIRALLETPELRLNLATAGQLRIHEQFTENLMRQSLVSAYLEVFKSDG
jgi:glycosyltransferase involved in cell wall biosynthesis